MTALLENGSGTTHIQNIAYPSLNKAGQPTAYTDNLNANNDVTSILYDAMGHMTEFRTPIVAFVYPTYDKNINRNYYANNSGSVGISKITLNSGTNQIYQMFTGTSGTTLFNTLTHNANGSVMAFSPGYGTAAVTGLSYNSAGQLASVSGSGGTLGSYIYDAGGQRFSKTVGTTTTIFQYAASGKLLAEANGTSETNYIYVNGNPVAMLTGSTFTWLHDDHLGTPQVATNSSQGTVWAQSYQPFGEVNTTSGSFTQNLRFPGQYFDAESGFNHNGFRDYVPSLGRYLEADPLGVYDFGEAEGINPYNYAVQDPMHSNDPSGLATEGEVCYSAGGGNINGQNTVFYYSRTFTSAGWGLQQKLGVYQGQPVGCFANQTLTFKTIKGGPDQWQWLIQWRLTQPSPKGGWIIQETIPDGQAPFWEAWQIQPGSNLTQVGNDLDEEDDTDQGLSYTGTGVNFSARFYEGLTLPPTFITENPNTSGAPSAAPATSINPNLPPSTGTPPVNRRWQPAPY